MRIKLNIFVSTLGEDIAFSLSDSVFIFSRAGPHSLVLKHILLDSGLVNNDVRPAGGVE